MVRNQYSQKGYRDVLLNISGKDAANIFGYIINLSVQCKNCQAHTVFFLFRLVCLSQQQGIGKEVITAVKFGDYCHQQKLDISLLWNQLPNVWVDTFVNAICDGNAVYDELYSDTAVYLDVEDVINAVGNDFHVQSANQMVGFTSACQ